MSCDPAALIQQINELQYLEYTNIGWMKAELLNVEALGSHLPSSASVGLPALLDRFHCDLDDAAIHRELIAFFLENWVCYQTPESSCAWWWHEDISRYQPVTRSTAVEMIDAMIAVSGGARKKWIEGEWWPEEKSRKERRYDVDYVQLADIFTNQLFASSCFYARFSSKKRKKRESWFHRTFSRKTDTQTQHVDTTICEPRSLIGISDVAIGMFWSFA